jgi:hypothetical protein
MSVPLTRWLHNPFIKFIHLFQTLESLHESRDVNILGLCLFIGTLDHFLEHFNLIEFLLQLVLHVLERSLSDLPQLHLHLHQLLLRLISLCFYTYILRSL